MNLEIIGERIAHLRRYAHFSQKELADRIGVSAQAISKWENGRNLPDIGNLMTLAEVLNVPYSAFLVTESARPEAGEIRFRNRLFNEENMFTRVRRFAAAENLTETDRALDFMRECHAGQFRKLGHFTTERIQYINHPLLMACQAHAYGVREDDVLAAILLHDTVEDTCVTLEELPFSDGVRELVGLLTFRVPEGMTKEEAKKVYYERIAGNGKACLIKILDRCNNVSTMAGSFGREKLIRYIRESEEYILPLTDVLKREYPEYCDIAFLVKYQIISILETIKSMMMEVTG